MLFIMDKLHRKNIIFHFSAFVLVLLVLLEGYYIPCIHASKLNRVVFQNETLDYSNQLDSTNWKNEGFLDTNATQITEILGEIKLNSSRFILARKIAHLETKWKNFEHTFLSIKFSSIIGKVLPIKPTTSITTTTTSTTATPVTVTSTSTLSTTQSIRKPNLRKIKLQSDPFEQKDASHIIEIALDQTVGTVEISGIKYDSEKVERKKRELNSEDLSQIHKIITEVNANKEQQITDDRRFTPTSSKPYPLAQPIPYQTPSIVPDVVVVKTQTLSKADIDISSRVDLTDDLKLPYKTWRASLEKNLRPPGFYLLVDDQVVFDNWMGVWYKPNVLGNLATSSAKKVWNETEILMKWEEPPNRDIKISFEWDPMDNESYLILDDILISTYTHAHNESLNTNNTSFNTSTNGQAITNSNKNITVYIVVKSLPQHPEAPKTTADLKSNPNISKAILVEVDSKQSSIGKASNDSNYNERNTFQADQKNNTVITSNSSANLTQNTTAIIQDTKITQRNANVTVHSAKTPRVKTASVSDNYGLITAIIVILVLILILASLIHTKVKQSRKTGNGC